MSHPNEPDQVQTGVLAVILALVTLAVLGIALYVTSLVRQEVGVVSAQRSEKQDLPTRELKNAQLLDLNKGPEYTDRARGLVQVPIERAMEMVLASVRENPEALSPGVKQGSAESANEPAAIAPGEKTSEKPEASEKPEKSTDSKPKKPAEKEPSAPAPAPAPVAPATP